MEYKFRDAGSYTVIEWTGDMDLSCSPDAREQVLRLLADRRRLIIDLTAVYHMDSSGVAVLVEAFQTSKKKRLRFAIAAAGQAVLSVLKLAKMDTILPLHASVESALGKDRAGSR